MQRLNYHLTFSKCWK